MTTFDPDKSYDARKDEYGPHSTKESRRIQDEKRDAIHAIDRLDREMEREKLIDPTSENNDSN